jgi:hypothetical protein
MMVERPETEGSCASWWRAGGGRGVIWAEDVERGERKTGGGLKVVFVELGVE